MNDNISHKTQSAVRSDRKFGFTTEMIALDRNLALADVQQIIKRTYRTVVVTGCSKESLYIEALREMKTAKAITDETQRAIQVRAVQGCFCDAVPDWRD